MFSKLFVWLLLVVTALSTPLHVTPEDLKEAFEIIESDILNRQSNASLIFRSLTSALEIYGNETKNAIITELTTASKLYWDEISLLQAIAESKDEDISACVELGAEEFYALNRSIIFAVSAKIDTLLEDALNEVIGSTDLSEEVLVKLEELSKEIDECSDDTCATTLQEELEEYYGEAVKTIDNATSEASEYISVYLPELLSEITTDIEAYRKSYEDILDDIRACMDSNVTELFET